jgi:type III secretory pathway lipoprotein EscJ
MVRIAMIESTVGVAGDERERTRSSQVKRKPTHNMAFHRTAVLKRMCLTKHAEQQADSPGHGGQTVDPDLAAKAAELLNLEEVPKKKLTFLKTLLQDYIVLTR